MNGYWVRTMLVLTLFLLVVTTFAPVGLCGPDEELQRAILEGATEKVKLQLDAGAAVNGPRRNGAPLSAAAMQGRLAIVEILLDRGADINLFYNGYPPLGIALDNQRLEVADYLLQRGVAGKSIDFALALMAGQGSVEWIERLLKRGANPDGTDLEGSALGNAARNGQTWIVQRLLQAGASVNKPYQGSGILGQRSALAEAVRYPEILEMLIANGADVNYRTSERSRPPQTSVLMLAAQEGNLNSVKQLVAAGADLYAVNRTGETAAILAEKKGHTSVAEYLRKATPN